MLFKTLAIIIASNVAGLLQTCQLFSQTSDPCLSSRLPVNRLPDFRSSVTPTLTRAGPGPWRWRSATEYVAVAEPPLGVVTVEGLQAFCQHSAGMAGIQLRAVARAALNHFPPFPSSYGSAMVFAD